MGQLRFVESDMLFVLDDKYAFRIEASQQYLKLKSDGIKTCEFILKRNQEILIVEAKKTCPNYIDRYTTDVNELKYREYVCDIAQKMRHSLALYASILLKKQEQDQMPDALKIADLSDVSLRLILIVKNAEKAWLVPYVDVFRKELHDVMKIWKITNFLVITEEMAREKKLVSDSIDF